MSTPQPGPVLCLGGCNKTFQSRDRRTNRICAKCAQRRVFMPPVINLGVSESPRTRKVRVRRDAR